MFELTSKDVGVGSSATISLDDTVVEVLGAFHFDVFLVATFKIIKITTSSQALAWRKK